MAKISASASLGVKLKFPKHDGRFDSYENVSPHASISIEREVLDAPNDVLVAQAGELYSKCRKFVEGEINEDIQTSKATKK